MRARDPAQPLRALWAVALLAAAATSFAACGSDEESTATDPDATKAAGHQATGRISAEIDEDPQGFVSSDVLRPLENAWRASDADGLTEVDAGALANDESTGALAIFRHDFTEVTQDVNLVEVKDSGPLRITNAPEGPDVEESAQASGKIEFEGENGVTGTLDLSDDSVSLNEPTG